MTAAQDWIYLSPHPDDVAISCGGLVWEQAQAGIPVAIWTICAGDPPAGPLTPFAESLHQRWQTGRGASLQRRREDRSACEILGAAYRHFPIPDCIYRRSKDGVALYDSEEAIFLDLHPAEVDVVEALSKTLRRSLPENARVVCPLAIGGHVDHRLTRSAAEATGRPLWYYADYPYAAKATREIDALTEAGWQARIYPTSPAGQLAWGQAVSAHSSQVSTFWKDEVSLQDTLAAYRLAMGGVRLWQPEQLAVA